MLKKFSARSWLIALLAFLLMTKGVLWFFSNWGLITVHLENKPLAEVIRSIERQGHVAIRTNFDPASPVTLHVTRVRLPVAMEQLSSAVRGRWRLAFAVGQDRSQAEAAVSAWQQGDDSAKKIAAPIPPMMSPGGIVDPRKDSWAMVPESAPELQKYLEQGARKADVIFLVLKTWNPSVPAPSARTERIDKAVRSLVKSAGGESKEFIALLKKPGPGAANPPEQAGGSPGDGPPLPPMLGGGEVPQQPGGDLPDPAAMKEMMKERIAKLPARQRERAEKQRAEMDRMQNEMKDLPPEERAEKMRQMAQGGGANSNPGGPGSAGSGGQQGGKGGSNTRPEQVQESKMTPSQNAQFSRKYVESKSAAQ